MSDESNIVQFPEKEIAGLDEALTDIMVKHWEEAALATEKIEMPCGAARPILFLLDARDIAIIATLKREGFSRYVESEPGRWGIELDWAKLAAALGYEFELVPD